MIMQKKKRTMILVGMIALVVLIAILILMYLVLATDTLKSSEDLFKKYVANAFENVEVFSNIEENNLDNSKYEANTRIKLNYTKNINTTNENQQNSFNDVTLKIDRQVDKQNKYDYKLLSLMKNTEKIGQIEYLKDNNTYGVHLPGIKQYICMESENQEDVFNDEKLSEDLQNVLKDNMSEINFDISSFKFSSEEQQQLLNTYQKIITENTSKENYAKQNGALITFNKESMNVNTYTLSLTKENYNNLKIKILEQLQKDEIILNKIDSIQEQIEQIQSQQNNFKQEFITSIDEEIEKIKNTNIGQEEVKISVYVKDNKAIRLSVDDTTTTTIIDFIGENPNMTIKISINKADVEVNSTEIVLTREKKENENILRGYFIKNKSEDINEIEFTLSDTQQNGNYYKAYDVSYNNGVDSISLNYEDDIYFVEEFGKDINYVNNSINLNSADEETKNKVYNSIKNKWQKQLDYMEAKVNLQDLRDMFSIFTSDDVSSLEETDTTEKDKERFNSQFELYKGDEVQKDGIEQLLSILEQNTSGSEIVSSDKDNLEIRITMENGANNSEGFEDIKELLNSKDFNNKKFKVDFNYSNEGFINETVITYVKE